MWVQISTIHGKNSNLVVNEKQAWVSRNLHLGTLVDGTVAEVYTFGARVKIKDTDIRCLFCKICILSP
jgi:ribosomal protein S1